jgi:hypothetical protein
MIKAHGPEAKAFAADRRLGPPSQVEALVFCVPGPRGEDSFDARFRRSAQGVVIVSSMRLIAKSLTTVPVKA